MNLLSIRWDLNRPWGEPINKGKMDSKMLRKRKLGCDGGGSTHRSGNGVKRSGNMSSKILYNVNVERHQINGRGLEGGKPKLAGCWKRRFLGRNGG